MGSFTKSFPEHSPCAEPRQNRNVREVRSCTPPPPPPDDSKRRRGEDSEEGNTAAESEQTNPRVKGADTELERQHYPQREEQPKVNCAAGVLDHDTPPGAES